MFWNLKGNFCKLLEDDEHQTIPQFLFSQQSAYSTKMDLKFSEFLKIH